MNTPVSMFYRILITRAFLHARKVHSRNQLNDVLLVSVWWLSYSNLQISSISLYSYLDNIYWFILLLFFYRQTTKISTRSPPWIWPPPRPLSQEHHMLRVRRINIKVDRSPSFRLWDQLQRFFCATIRQARQGYFIKREVVGNRRHEDEGPGLGQSYPSGCGKLQVRQDMLHGWCEETKIQGCLRYASRFYQGRWVLSSLPDHIVFLILSVGNHVWNCKGCKIFIVV